MHLEGRCMHARRYQWRKQQCTLDTVPGGKHGNRNDMGMLKSGIRSTIACLKKSFPPMCLSRMQLLQQGC